MIDSPEGLVFRTTITGLTGQGAIVVYASTNLVDWQAVTTNPPVIGNLIIEDLLSSEAAATFYRAVEHRQ